MLQVDDHSFEAMPIVLHDLCAIIKHKQCPAILAITNLFLLAAELTIDETSNKRLCCFISATLMMKLETLVCLQVELFEDGGSEECQ